MASRRAKDGNQRQVLANLIVEFTPGPPTQCNLLDGWVLNMDGTSNSKGFGIEIVFTPPKGSIIE